MGWLIDEVDVDVDAVVGCRGVYYGADGLGCFVMMFDHAFYVVGFCVDFE